MEGAAGSIRVGVAGWDYPDWTGIVYPARSGPAFDRLAYLARFVDVVEINSTFYHPADPRRAASWARRAAEKRGFRFTAKAHRSWTHEDRAPAAVVPPVLSGLAPLRDAGVLGAILIQFPQSFHRVPASVARLERLLDAGRGWPVAIEVRHASWSHDETRRVLTSRGAGLCVVDQPRAGGATLSATAAVTSRVAYLRLHGRNEAAWFREDAGRDARYDYLYDDDELRPLAAMAVAMAGEAAEVFVVQNNHFRGQGLANALMMKHLIGQGRPEAPEELCAAYPALRQIVTPRRATLFGPEG